MGFSLCQRAQPDELEKIRKHYETSDEEDVKLLDKPEQSVFLQTGVFRVHSSIYEGRSTIKRKMGSKIYVVITVNVL